MQCLLLSLLILTSLAAAQDYDDEYESDPNAIDGLPASADVVLGIPFDDGFNCDQQDAGYGYYADVNNECKVFHICNPVYDFENLLIRMDKYSFICGEGTMFDQGTLTCNWPEDSVPCEDSPSLYGAIIYGQKIDDY